LGTGINKSTLTAFDTVDGGAGNDTINISFGLNSNSTATNLTTSDLNSALLGVTNVEKLNIISEIQAADGTGLTINGYKSVSLNIVGETKIADTDATKLNIKASGNVTVTKAEAVKDLSINAANSVVSIVANATKALENLTIKNASKLTAENAFDGDTLKSVTLSNVTLGDTAAAAAFDFKGVSTLNFDNVVSAQTGDNKYAHITSTAETLNLNLSGKTATVALVTNTVTKVANITANADSNNFLITKADGSKDPTHADLQNDSFTTFIVKGSGKELLLDAGDLDNVTSIDASGFSGNAKIAFGDTDAVEGSQLSVKTGAGNDTLTLEAKKLKAGSLIDGGAGNDTIIMKASALADAATLGMIKNIENVTVSDALSANTDVSASSFVNIGLLGDNAGGGTDAILTINKDQIVDIQTAKLAENKKVTIKLNDATGTDDAVNIVLNAKAIIGADKSVAVGANDAAKLLVIDSAIETVNITSVAKDSSTANTLTMQVSTDGTSGANKVVVTGDGAITITAATAATDLKTIKDLDASALTGKLTFDASVNKLASGAAIKGGSGDDIITVGYDTQVVTLGAGNDTVVLKAGNADIAKYSTITDFSKGDKIDISQLKAANAATSISKAEKLASTATFTEQVEAILKSDGSTTAVAKYFQFGGDTYIVVDTANAATTTITAATDGIIKLAGFTGDLAIDAGSLITVA
ncbi:S-layer protein, partial [Campylobacter fetus]|uniref:S-layer protein n=1 Tax=Campylobacter fetus TaxID=196 RepID=UPI001300F362